MTTTLLTGIGLLATQDPELGEIADAALLIDGDRIGWLGPAAQAPAADTAVDLGGRCVLPGFVDSHAHLVFAGDRAEEFAARMTGQPYTAGGIRSTVAATRAASDDQLRANLARLAAELHAAGVTTFECKSGYGLDVATEQRSRPDRRRADARGDLPRRPRGAGRHRPRPTTSTWCAGRCWPPARRTPAGWTCSASRAPSTSTRAGRCCAAGIAAGLQPRLHANQLTAGGGVALAVELDAASADHCTHLSAADIDALAGSTRWRPCCRWSSSPPARPTPTPAACWTPGATVALATDCNPGSGFSTSMPLAIALAVREMRMTPAEAVHAATAGGARALRRTDIGRLAVGLRADLTVLDAPSYLHLAYRPGVPLISRVWQAGQEIPLR